MPGTQRYRDVTNMWDVAIKDLAEQWTVLEFCMFQAIPLVEFMDKAWGEPRCVQGVRCYLAHRVGTRLQRGRLRKRAPDASRVSTCMCGRYEHRADHVRAFIDRFNASSLFVTATVVNVRASSPPPPPPCCCQSCDSGRNSRLNEWLCPMRRERPRRSERA